MNMLSVVSFFVGLVFSIGLGLSGMTDPNKVLDFLDVTRKWDPSLMFVMGSAIPVYFIFWMMMKRRTKPLLDLKMHIPTRRDIDKKLVLGAAIFGVGWGIGGICPGPAIASLGALSQAAVVFIVCFYIGGVILKKVERFL